MQCAQQSSGSLSCGFYVALDMYDLLGDINVIKKASVSIYIFYVAIIRDEEALKELTIMEP